MKRNHLLATWLAVCTGVAAAQAVPNEQSLALLNGVLWTQQAVEHQAASQATYRAAGAALRVVARQPGWASLETGPATTGRKAIVMDIDETIVDNSAYSAWMVQSGRPYDEPSWQDWVALRQAVAIPGAVEFVRLAQRLGVDVFFVTNRECVPRGDDACPAFAHTRDNLVSLGFTRAAEPGALILRKQRPEWSAGDKTARRQFIAQTHRIVMLFGDDMGDFLPLDKVEALRAGHPDAPTTRAMTQLGRRWFVIANPMYGSWEKVVPHAIPERVGALKPPQGWAASAPGGAR